MPQFTAEELKSKSVEELAILGERNSPISAEGILVSEERQRRYRLEQHKLDMELMIKQVRSMRFAAIIGVIATLIGAILGAYLQYSLPQWSHNNTQLTIKQEIGKSFLKEHDSKKDSPILSTIRGNPLLSKSTSKE